MRFPIRWFQAVGPVSSTPKRKAAVAALKPRQVAVVFHDEIVSEVMTEVAEDYFPGMRMVGEES